jgi:hypothetical protein
MRTSLLTAAVLAAVAATAAAATGYLTETGGAVTLTGRGTSAGNELAASCSYDGGTLTMTVAALAPTGAHVEGECVLYTDRVANGVWAEASGVPVAAVTESRAVEPGVRARQLCLLASASWTGGDSVWLQRCVDA